MASVLFRSAAWAALLFLAAPSAAAPAVDAAARAEFEAGLLGSEGGAIARAIKRNYPEDYERFLTDMIERALPRLDDEAALALIGFEGAQRFFRDKLPDAQRAPVASLVAVNAAQREVIELLRQEDVAACAEFATSGIGPDTRLSPAADAKMELLAIRLLDAAGAGARASRDAAPVSLDVEAAAAWMDEIARIDPSPEIAALLQDEAGQAGAPPEQLCRLGVVLYAATSRLPAEQAANITAFMLAEAGTSQP